jgi:hypothetical protein
MTKGDEKQTTQDVELTESQLLDEKRKKLREKVKDTFAYYPDENVLLVADDGTPFLESSKNFATHYGISQKQTIHVIKR